MSGIWKKAACAAAAVLTLGISTALEASHLDTYRNLLVNRTYKIRYENITPPPRVTNRNKAPLFGKNGLSSEGNSLLRNRSRVGIITANGENKYEELAGEGPKGTFYSCHLTKNGEDFYFTKWQEDGQWQYAGNVKDKDKVKVKKGQVSAQAPNVLSELVSGENYGEEDLSRLLGAILPAAKRSADMPAYEAVGSGWLDNGLNYEDYSAETENGLNVIRYYFNQYTLVKIAEASYHQNADGTYSGRRCIIKIDEFSPTPDAALLRLPDGLEDKTKRDGEKGENEE